ncbi:hypothetical protein SDC9_101414 [bioreactor metagenome]|uniref:Sce7726 family protein n=2 Tax=root TaxID=1 RepID=A0A645AN32_9ZZZZ|nr:sce7726 family protein [Desulfovibrio desulfuricans]MCB6541381.1 sce7726 family protein [Desulfovibrio desulfuricans]MCB6552463.1 sce7726 family protein [Desulfovibrio desulfuricans]MCB6564289.1 sce7726 family protein [Desulfovibrio desulfuricans]MCB7345487.1 sce7726 family protein [Desulfovibrio desulfuricans]MCQ4860889.1 sce7726 family protein [Desulfovibrio desulfuricans]
MASNKRNFKALAELFKPRFLHRLAMDDYKDLLSEVLVASGSIKEFSKIKRLPTLFKKAYSALLSHCKYEYVYKTAILNDVFLKYHNFNSAFYTTEFYCGKSKADIAIFNGCSTVYEIKTKYDNLEKLDKQLRDYRKIFSKQFVVVDCKHLVNVKKIVDSSVGILLFQEDGALLEIRNAVEDAAGIDTGALFDCLHKKEYKDIVHKYIGRELAVPNALEYASYKKIFVELPREDAMSQVVERLRSRSIPTQRRALLEKSPSCLGQAIIDSNLTVSMSMSIISKMEKPFAII